LEFISRAECGNVLEQITSCIPNGCPYIVIIPDAKGIGVRASGPDVVLITSLLKVLNDLEGRENYHGQF